MRPDAAEQIAGAAHVLESAIAPLVDDAYSIDVLHGTLANLRMVAAALDAVPPFLLWDVEGTITILELAGVTVTPVELAPFDLPALRERHREIRELLEANVATVRANEAANSAAVAHFRERAARYPFVSTYRGGSLARRS